MRACDECGERTDGMGAAKSMYSGNSSGESSRTSESDGGAPVLDGPMGPREGMYSPSNLPVLHMLNRTASSPRNLKLCEEKQREKELFENSEEWEKGCEKGRERERDT